MSSSHTGLQDAFDDDWQAGRLNSVGYLNGTEDGILAYKLLLQTGSEKEPLNYKLVCWPDPGGGVRGPTCTQTVF